MIKFYLKEIEINNFKTIIRPLKISDLKPFSILLVPGCHDKSMIFEAIEFGFATDSNVANAEVVLHFGHVVDAQTVQSVVLKRRRQTIQTEVVDNYFSLDNAQFKAIDKNEFCAILIKFNIRINSRNHSFLIDQSVIEQYLPGMNITPILENIIGSDVYNDPFDKLTLKQNNELLQKKRLMAYGRHLKSKDLEFSDSMIIQEDKNRALENKNLYELFYMFAEIDSVTEILATRTVEPVVEELNLDNQLNLLPETLQLNLNLASNALKSEKFLLDDINRKKNEKKIQLNKLEEYIRKAESMHNTFANNTAMTNPFNESVAKEFFQLLCEFEKQTIQLSINQFDIQMKADLANFSEIEAQDLTDEFTQELIATRKKADDTQFKIDRQKRVLNEKMKLETERLKYVRDKEKLKNLDDQNRNKFASFMEQSRLPIALAGSKDVLWKIGQMIHSYKTLNPDAQPLDYIFEDLSDFHFAENASTSKNMMEKLVEKDHKGIVMIVRSLIPPKPVPFATVKDEFEKYKLFDHTTPVIILRLLQKYVMCDTQDQAQLILKDHPQLIAILKDGTAIDHLNLVRFGKYNIFKIMYEDVNFDAARTSSTFTEPDLFLLNELRSEIDKHWRDISHLRVVLAEHKSTESDLLNKIEKLKNGSSPIVATDIDIEKQITNIKQNILKPFIEKYQIHDVDIYEQLIIDMVINRSFDLLQIKRHIIEKQLERDLLQKSIDCNSASQSQAETVKTNLKQTITDLKDLRKSNKFHEPMIYDLSWHTSKNNYLKKSVSELSRNYDIGEKEYLVRKATALFEERKREGLRLPDGPPSAHMLYNCLPTEFQTPCTLFEMIDILEDLKAECAKTEQPILNTTHNQSTEIALNRKKVSDLTKAITSNYRELREITAKRAELFMPFFETLLDSIKTIYPELMQNKSSELIFMYPNEEEPFMGIIDYTYIVSPATSLKDEQADNNRQLAALAILFGINAALNSPTLILGDFDSMLSEKGAENFIRFLIKLAAKRDRQVIAMCSNPTYSYLSNADQIQLVWQNRLEEFQIFEVSDICKKITH